MIIKLLKLVTFFFILKSLIKIYQFIASKLFNYKFYRRISGKRVIVTGASDGIGRQLAILLSNYFEVILIGRNRKKLEDVSKLCKNKTEIQVFDFSCECNFPEYQNIGLLINNCGVSSEHPNYLSDENRLEEIIFVNCLNTLKITKKVIKCMAESKCGYVVNIGSMLGDFPSPLLSVYSASKSFLKSWTESLYYEMMPFGVNVQLMDTGMVATKMSKVKRSSFFIPSAEKYAAAVLSSIGSSKFSVPYFPHLLIYLVIDIIPKDIMGLFTLFYTYAVRNKALNRKRKIQ
ncbi:Very-long-chain 3-oxoacyl-CoA reductase [Dictyocoela muelleri]|nr:Very-long-chain 3-oxoacyl-CoA reductase [Dictyocoela muelleri]